MIIDSKERQDIFLGDENVVVFAINTEGTNDAGFAGLVASKYWPELANMGECELGSVFQKEIDGKKYCAIVCHSLEKGWGTPEEQTKTIKECFDKIDIEPGDKIASIAIGNGIIGQVLGADYEAIVQGMHESDKEVTLYGYVPEKIKAEISENMENLQEERNNISDAIDTNYYTDIKQLEADVEKLGDWKDPSQRDNYFKVLAKITAMYYGYKDENGEIHRGGNLIKAACLICSKKFPKRVEPFDKDGDLLAGFPEYSKYLVLTEEPLRVSLMGERTEMYKIALEEFGMDIDHVKMPSKDCENLEKSAEEYIKNYGSKIMWEPHTDKANVPYYKVAKQALMNWNRLSEQEAMEKINSSRFADVEGMVDASGSIDYAIDAISKKCDLTEDEKYTFEERIYRGPKKYGDFSGEVFEKISQSLAEKEISNEEFILDILSAVHDGWVKEKDNEKKFNAREKKHQHFPIELIGWKEAKADLLFVKPIMEELGIQVDEKLLEEAYNQRSQQFLKDRGIRSKEDLARQIANGVEFYPVWEGQESILETVTNPELLEEKGVIEQIETNGIGPIQITEDEKSTNNKGLDDMSVEELEKMNKELNDKIDQSEKELENLEKRKLIEEILEKSSKLKELKYKINKILENNEPEKPEGPEDPE